MLYPLGRGFSRRCAKSVVRRPWSVVKDNPRRTTDNGPPTTDKRLMQNGHIEGILQITDERQDGHLRELLNPLRPVRGNIAVPRQVIRNLQLRPGLLLSG